MLAGRANCLIRILHRSITQNDFGENVHSFTLWRQAWAESWVDRGAEPVQANEPQSAPIRNFRVDWAEVMLPDPDGTVIREDMVIEVDGETALQEGVLVPRKFDIMLIMQDYAGRKHCVIRVKERRNHV
jgi:head-tail adaptor